MYPNTLVCNFLNFHDITYTVTLVSTLSQNGFKPIKLPYFDWKLGLVSL